MNYVGYHAINGFLVVRGNCRICKERIEKSALSVNGVSFADWNISDGRLALSFDSDRTSLEEISLAIASVGHETDLHKVDASILEQMPICCRPIT